MGQRGPYSLLNGEEVVGKTLTPIAMSEVGEEEPQNLDASHLTKRKPGAESAVEGEIVKKQKSEIPSDPAIVEGQENEEPEKEVNGKSNGGDKKGKGVVLAVDKGKGKALMVDEEEGEDSDGEDDSSGDDDEDDDGGGIGRGDGEDDSDFDDDPLAEVDLDNVLPSRTRRKVPPPPGSYLVNDLDDDDDDDDDEGFD